MKILNYLICALLVLAMYACSSDEPMTVMSSECVSQADDGFLLSEDDAVEMANAAMGRSFSRSGELAVKSVEYVLEDGAYARKASADGSVAAYVINYADDAGFAVVATDKRIEDLLAFSDRGSFSFDNEIVQHYFIENIPAYVSRKVNETPDAARASATSLLERTIEPAVVTELDQIAPYNKYILEDDPTHTLAGCVPVATATIMAHAKDFLNYQQHSYYFKMIRDLYVSKSNTVPPTRIRIDDGGLVGPIYNMAPTTYDRAIDEMARIMLPIGADVDADYQGEKTNASSSDALRLLKDLGYDCTDFIVDLTGKGAIKYLKDGYLIYVHGKNQSSGTGHAWVCDGAKYILSYMDFTEIARFYLHFDWGWGGLCNGYYEGDVFSLPEISRKYRITAYFAVKNEGTY